MEGDKVDQSQTSCQNAPSSSRSVSSGFSAHPNPSSDPAFGHTLPVKRKRIHMNDTQCLGHSMTSHGAQPLTNPNPQGLAKRPNLDVNRGLYPRQSQPRRGTIHQYSKPSSSAGRFSQASPMKQSNLDTFLSLSPEKCLQSAHMASSPRKPAMTFQTRLDDTKFQKSRTVGPSTSFGGGGQFTSGFNKPMNVVKKSPIKSPHQLISPQLHGRVRNCVGSGKAVIPKGHVSGVAPVRSLFQGRTRKSSDLIKAFEDDDSITPEIFDNVIGSCQETKKLKPQSFSSLEQEFEDDDFITAEEFDDVLQSSQGSVKEEKPSNVEKDFADDNSFTAEEFDDILQSSQGSVKSNRKEVQGKTSSLEKDFADDDSFTAEEFDEVLLSSQGSVHSNPTERLGKLSSLEKDFQDDDSFTAEEFDEVLQASQGSVHSTPVKIQGESSSVVKDFEDDDCFTVEEFDDALQSSQSPVKNFPTALQSIGSHSSKDWRSLPSNSEKDTKQVERTKAIIESSRGFSASTGSCVHHDINVDKPGTSSSTSSNMMAIKYHRTTHSDTLPGEIAAGHSRVTEDPRDHIKSSHGPSPSPCTFGLLGEEFTLSPAHERENSPTDYFGGLPDEVLENILGQLPIQDMCLTAARVCKRWHGIVSGEQFVPWKKRYHRLKKLQSIDERRAVKRMLASSGSLASSSCLLQLIRFMGSLRVDGQSAIQGLRCHTKFQAALQVMKERVPKVFTNQEPHPWAVVATIVILSETAQEVCRLLDCLLRRKQPVPRMEVSECFYCIAASLFLFQMKYHINRGLHFRVFNALHKLESNEVGDDEELSDTAKKSIGGQQSLLRYGQRQGMKLTPEQMRIINHKLMPADTIKIIAFAGTGKTTTLIRFSQLRPNLNFLYIAFNKTVQQQASRKFPSNVECRTLHSLAYRAVGFKYRMKLGSMLKPFYIQSLLPETDDPVLHHMTMAKHVCTTIEHFLASDDAFMTTAHTPAWDTTKTPRRPLTHRIRMAIAKAAERVFAALCDLNNTDAKITHDVYLKLYEMQKPKLKGYDCLLIDEAQDLTPAQQSILLGQSCAKILVGDPHQQIYSFRGATNAMARVEATRIYQLTQSFRFGPEIAYVSNCLLEALKQQTKSTMIGAGPPGYVLGESIGQVATVCRSNAAVFMEAVKMVTKSDSVKIEFSGGIDGYGFDKTLDIYYLSLPEGERGHYRTRDRFISRFKSFASLQAYAMKAEDADLQSRIKLVLLFHSRIPSLIEKIKRCSVSLNGDVLLTTAHKAKGLEFDTVQLTEDFIEETVDAAGNDIPEDEKNILYVAVTRAKKCLLLNHTLCHFLSTVQEKFEYPILAKEVRDKEGPPRCQECGQVQDDPKKLLLVQRKRIKLVHSLRHRDIERGFVCPTCVEAKGFEGLYGKPLAVVQVLDREEDDEMEELDIPDLMDF